MKTKSVIVFGGGRVGLTIARDLAETYTVAIADVDKSRLDEIQNSFELKTIHLDLLSEKDPTKLLQAYDLAVNAVPGHIGFVFLKKLAENGINVVDISFFDQDAYDLDELCIEQACSAVVDCGVAPGLCNIMLGHHLSEEVISYSCYVGGLPFQPTEPFNYKAPFSPSDVIEEYTRPARLRENGIDITKDALSEIEEISIPEIGSLEAFNTDGLRSILRNTDIPNLKEKTIRYKGHAALMKSFREAGFFDNELIEVGTEKIPAIEFTSKVLFNEWKLNDEDDEFTYMKVEIETPSGYHVYKVFDRKDFEKNMSSMSRTTGFTCSATCAYYLQNEFQTTGILAPEQLGKDNSYFDFVISYLKERGVDIQYEYIEKLA